MLIYQDRHDVTKQGKFIKVRDSHKENILTRCDEFCRQVTTKLSSENYDKISKFSTLGVIVGGRALEQAKDEYGYRAGMLGDEIRRPAMAIDSVEIVKGGDADVTAQFKAMFPQLFDRATPLTAKMPPPPSHCLPFSDLGHNAPKPDSSQ